VDNPVITLSQTHSVAHQLRAGVKLIKNWSDDFQHNLQHPETVDEAVDRLMMILDGEQKLAIAVMQEEDLINLHFGLGMAIRNAFGLHEQGSKLLASCNNNELYNSVHPDDASEVIIDALWLKLTQGTQ
jgi:aromatic ring-opening dioxygenase catalytic subunit (LigB family)